MLTKVFQLTKYPALDSATLRSNLRAHIMDGALFGFAMSFVSVTTIMPVFIQQIGGSAVAIGSVPVLWTVGLNLPQAVFVRFTQAGKLVRPSVLRFGFLHRVSFLIVGLFAFFVIGRLPSTLSVPILMILLFSVAVTGSLGVPPWFHLFTKTTPVRLRGRLLALRQLLSSFLGILGGLAVTIILSALPLPANFALLFVVAFILSMVSYFYLRVLKEPISESVGKRIEDSVGIFHQARLILGRDKNFRNFLIVDASTLMSMTASAFYSVHAIQEFNLPPSYAGTFTVIVMASMAAGNILFGYIADSFGHKMNLMLLAGASVAASVVALFAGNILVYGFAFFFMAMTIGLQGISRLSFVAEMCTEVDRPTYIALTNTLTAPTVAVGILLGWIARTYGFQPVFAAGMLFGLFALVKLHFGVRDPRVHATSTVIDSRDDRR